MVEFVWDVYISNSYDILIPTTCIAYKKVYLIIALDFLLLPIAKVHQNNHRASQQLKSTRGTWFLHGKNHLTTMHQYKGTTFSITSQYLLMGSWSKSCLSQ